eukprot:3939603-Rhodomonas_salina.2
MRCDAMQGAELTKEAIGVVPRAGDYHFNYTYNFFNHIHTNKDVTVKNEIGETQTLQITRRRQRPWNINRAPMLALVQELEEVIGKQQRKRNVSVKDHFAVLRAWIAQVWGLLSFWFFSFFSSPFFRSHTDGPGSWRRLGTLRRVETRWHAGTHASTLTDTDRQ